MNDNTAQQPAFGLNVIGHVSGNFGLAVACRNTLRALSSRANALCVLDVDAGGGRSGHDLSYEGLACPERPLPYAVNLLHMNPPDVVNVCIDTPKAIGFGPRLNVSVPFYELPYLPEGEWTRLLDNVDVVLAPTRHIEQIVRRSCPETTVLHYPQAVFLPEGIVSDRAQWDLPSDAFLCFVAMDVSSDVERKNPWAAIEAFQRAFPAERAENALLVVKLNNTRIARRYERDADALMERLGRDSRVRVFTETMPYHRSLALSAACDVYLSMHRAEGLGLNLMEAMSLGKPVIATGWSGNTDFMTAENSVPVAYELVAVETSHPSYRTAAATKPQTWAEPDVEDAAAQLRKLYENPDLRATIGAAAARSMDAARSDFLAARWVDDLLGMWDRGESRTEAHAARAARLEELKHPGAVRVIRRRGGKVLRRLGLMR